MGCDIHLRLERRLKKDKVWNEYYTEKAGEWKGCSNIKSGQCWGDRIYGMFAVLADVRNKWDIEHLPLRGLPDDCSDLTLECYGKRIANKAREQCYDFEYAREDAEKWIRQEASTRYSVYNLEYCSNPDWHSPNWCTTQEMEDCINKIFKNDDGTYEGDYIEWLALLGTMKGYEASGEYECRAVFWFDN